MRHRSAGGAILLALLLPIGGWLYFRAGMRALHQEDMAAMGKQIAVSLFLYADRNGGVFPTESGAAGLSRLFETGILREENRSMIQDPLAHNLPQPGTLIVEAETSFHYVGGHRRDDPPNTIVLVQKRPAKANWGFVVYANGRVLPLRGDSWRRVCSTMTSEKVRRHFR